MEEKNKREEIQSRREFFKKAAKAALPVVGAAILSSVPWNLSATGVKATSCSGCNNRCMNTCFNTCYEKCNKHCQDSCNSSCYTGCKRSSY